MVQNYVLTRYNNCQNAILTTDLPKKTNINFTTLTRKNGCISSKYQSLLTDLFAPLKLNCFIFACALAKSINTKTTHFAHFDFFRKWERYLGNIAYSSGYIK